MNETPFWSQMREIVSLTTDSLDTFKIWPVVEMVPLYQKTNYFDGYKYEVEALMTKLEKYETEKLHKWAASFKEPFLGHTEESYKEVINGIWGNIPCSTWTLKTAYHLMTHDDMSDRSFLDYDQIVEFGAGIGEIARMAIDMGFDKDYYIYDLPEVANLSKFYLKDKPNVLFPEYIQNIPVRNKTLFIATWSLSEVPFGFRDEILTHFGSIDYFIVFQNFFYNLRNREYFLNEFPEITKTWYKLRPIDFHVGYGGNFSMVARGTKW